MPSFPDSAVVTFPLPASGPGGEGVDLNYARTQFGYDSAGRQNRVVAPEGTITRTTFDPLGRQIGLYVGTKLYKLYYSGDIIGDTILNSSALPPEPANSP